MISWRDILLSGDRPTLRRLSDSVNKVKALLSKKQIIELAKTLEGLGFSFPTLNDMDKLNLSPNQRDRLKRYLKEIIKKEELMAVFLTLFELVKVETSLPLEICWTGPSLEPHVRMTWPVLSEIILDAKKSILIVGYTITTKMGKIMDYLEEKSKDGVKLVFFIDRVNEKHDFLQWVRQLPPPITLYDRPEDPDDPFSALHIKCIIVDERIAMFGSANFTYHGTKGNIELGIVIKNEDTVKRMVHLLNGLKTQLVKIDFKR